MKRPVVIFSILCLLVGAALFIPQVKRSIVLTCLTVAGRLGVPLDEASAQVSRVGTYKEYTVSDPLYDVLIYYFDGTRGETPSSMVSTGLKAIRKGGFNYSKKMTLLIFCDLTRTDKSPKAVYPYGLFLDSAAIKNRGISLEDLAGSPLIKSPMNWDSGINDWIYTTNNMSNSGPQVSENADYTKSTNALERGWFLDLDHLTNKVEVYAKFGKPQYYVRESGTYSEMYPVDDENRSQAGTVRIWYVGDRVTRTGCYMTNK